MMKKIKDYSITDHGVEHEQYFQGDGVSFTKYTDCATGVGSSAYEALEDAIDSLVQGDWDVAVIVNNLSKETDVPEDADAHYHYVTIKVR